MWIYEWTRVSAENYVFKRVSIKFKFAVEVGAQVRVEVGVEVGAQVGQNSDHSQHASASEKKSSIHISWLQVLKLQTSEGWK
jgi:hypothetical protein